MGVINLNRKPNRRLQVIILIALCVIVMSIIIIIGRKSLVGNIILKDNESASENQEIPQAADKDKKDTDVSPDNKPGVINNDNAFSEKLKSLSPTSPISPAQIQELHQKKYVSSELADIAAKKGEIRVIVKLKNDDKKKELKSRLGGIKEAKGYISGLINKNTAYNLINSLGADNIEMIAVDHIISLAADSVTEHVGADQVWSAGFTGKGQTVCVIDSGIDYTHPSLAGKYVGGYDFVNYDDDPMDDNGHGTYVSGIVAGVAPDAKIVAVKSFDEKGNAFESDLIAGIDYCLQNKDAYDISVILMAFGGGRFDTSCFCDSNLVAEEANYAVSQGLFAVAASGNNGVDYLKAPACGSSVTSVGAVESDDDIATFTDIDPLLDLLAPGVSIESAKMGGGLESRSGTSASAAVVAGAATLLLENEALSPLDLQYRFRSTGVIIPHEGIDYPRVDAYAALMNYSTNTPVEQQGTQCEGEWTDYNLLASDCSGGACDMGGGICTYCCKGSELCEGQWCDLVCTGSETCSCSTDECMADCDDASDCPSCSSCPRSASCQYTVASCPSPGCTCDTSGSYDPDASSTYCDSSKNGCTSLRWNIGGAADATTCCADDVGEWVQRCLNATGFPKNLTSGNCNSTATACCSTNTSCVTTNGSTCFTASNTSFLDADWSGDSDWCYNGTWYDCYNDTNCAAGVSCVSYQCVNLSAISNKTGGNYNGSDLIVNTSRILCGNHYNISTFRVNTGVVLDVGVFNGTACGNLTINATHIYVYGTINGSAAGYGGGGGGGGGAGGYYGSGSCTDAGGGGTATGNGSNGLPGDYCSGSPGGSGGDGGDGGGLYAGAGAGPESSGQNGGYAKWYGNGDSSTDETLYMGSGGGGGGGGGGGDGNAYEDPMYGAGGGGGGAGAGNPGGARIWLYASADIIINGTVNASGRAMNTGDGNIGSAGTQGPSGGNGGQGGSGGSAVYYGETSTGAAGGNGANEPYGDTPGNTGGNGGAGAGGGILLKAPIINLTSAKIYALGGGGNSTIGGTIKIFYGCSLVNATYQANRTYIEGDSGVLRGGNGTTCSSSVKCFYLQNTSGIAAKFDQNGYVDIRGNYSFAQSSLTPPDDSFVIRNSTAIVLYIDKAGNLATRGNFYQCPDPAPSGANDFIISDTSGEPAGFIDGATGDMFFKGTLHYNSEAAWANTSFERCRTIYINNSGSEVLYNFPVFINLSYDPEMQSNFSDLRFYDSDCFNGGNRIDYEIENYTASTSAKIWVEIPTLTSPGKAISVYYYNNTDIGGVGQNATAVWNSSFVGVWHMNAMNATDSTNNSLNCKSSKPGNITLNSAAMVDGGVNFGGTRTTNYYINCTNGSSSNVLNPTSITLESWVYLKGNVTSGQQQAVLAKGSAPYQYDIYRTSGAPNMYPFLCNATACNGGGAPFSGTGGANVTLYTWHYLAVTYNQATIQSYQDGKLNTSSAAMTGPLNATSNKFGIGGYVTSFNQFNGTIDEVRISNFARSANWINQTYLVINNQSQYVTVGPEYFR